MEELIFKLVHTNSGYFYESAGVINAFFDDPAKAHQCAKKISEAIGINVEVCGDQIIVELS